MIHSSDINVNTTWYKADNPHIITIWLSVYADLTLEPGCIVQFRSGASIGASDSPLGRIIAEGTEDEWITFEAETTCTDDIWIDSWSSTTGYTNLSYCKFNMLNCTRVYPCEGLFPESGSIDHILMYGDWESGTPNCYEISKNFAPTVTIDHLTAYKCRSVIGCYNGTLNVKNSIIIGAQYALYASSGDTLNSTYNDLWDNDNNYFGTGTIGAGTGDISADPLFVGGAPYSLELTPSSPCYSSGESGTYMGALEPLPQYFEDINSDIRIKGISAEYDIDNDMRTQKLELSDINNDIRAVNTISIVRDINNDIRTRDDVLVLGDINLDIRVHTLTIDNISTDIRVHDDAFTNMDIDVRAFDKIPVLRDLNIDIRTAQEEIQDIANDIRYKVSSRTSRVVERALTIKEGDYVNSTAVTLFLEVDFASQMRFQNDVTTGAWSAWETYIEEKSWVLSGGDGPKIVYAQFNDIVGDETDGSLFGITTLDTTSPVMTSINCYTEDGGSSIADSTYQIDHSPYFDWVVPSFSGTIIGYKYTMDNASMGDDTNIVQPYLIVESGLVVAPNSGMLIQAEIGVYYFQGNRIAYPSGTILLTDGGAQDRIDLIYIDTIDNTLKRVEGTESVTPVVPDEPASAVYVADVLVQAGVILINAGDITDKRTTKVKLNFYETAYLSSGTHKLRVRARGANDEWSNTAEFNIYVSSESPDIGVIQCWRDNTKIISMADAVYQTVDNTPYFEWIAPTAPGTMTYYYTLDGTIPDSGSSSTANNYLDYVGSPFGIGTHVLTVRTRDSFGTWGTSRIFTFIYGTVSASGETLVVGPSNTLRQSQKEVQVHRVEVSLRSARLCEFEEPVEFDADGSYNYGNIVTIIHNGFTVFRGVIKHIRRVLRADKEAIIYQAVGPRAELSEEYAYIIDDEIGATTQIKFEDITFQDAIDKIVSKFPHLVKSVNSYPSGANITVELIGLPVDQALQRIYEESGHYGYYISTDGILYTVDWNATNAASVYFGVYGQKISAHPEYDILSSDLNIDITGRYNSLVIEGQRKREIITVPAYWSFPQASYSRHELNDIRTPEWQYNAQRYIPQTDKLILKLLDWDINYYRVLGWRSWGSGNSIFHYKTAIHNKVTEVFKDHIAPDKDSRGEKTGNYVKAFYSKTAISRFDETTPRLTPDGLIMFNGPMYSSTGNPIGYSSPGRKSATVFVTLLVETVPLKVTVTQSGSADSVAKIKRIYDSSFKYDESESIDDTARMIEFGQNQLSASKDIKLSGSVLLDDVDTTWDLTKTVNLQNANLARSWNSINAKITSVTWNFDANTTNIELTTEYLGG